MISSSEATLPGLSATQVNDGAHVHGGMLVKRFFDLGGVDVLAADVHILLTIDDVKLSFRFNGGLIFSQCQTGDRRRLPNRAKYTRDRSTAHRWLPDKWALPGDGIANYRCPPALR
jgi:hypothetical protein